jgi:hypothetical protein
MLPRIGSSARECPKPQPLGIDLCQTRNPFDHIVGVAVKTRFAIDEVLHRIVRAIADEGLWVKANQGSL